MQQLDEAKTGLPSLQKDLKMAIKNSKTGLKGRAAKILEGISRSVEEDAAAKILFENSRIKGFFIENWGYIHKIREKIASMLPLKSQNGQ